jgi:hypothetical protein
MIWGLSVARDFLHCHSLPLARRLENWLADVFAMTVSGVTLLISKGLVP